MENKQFPEQEDDLPLTEEELPQQILPTEEPIPEEPAAVPAEEAPAEPAMASEEESQPVQAVPLFFQEEAPQWQLPEEDFSDPLNFPPEPAQSSPLPEEAPESLELPEKAPDESGFQEDPRMSAPVQGQEIQPDDSAMVGMLGHGEVEPPFDLSILDDPELDLALEPEDTQPDAVSAQEAEAQDSEDPDDADQEYRDDPPPPEETPKRTAPLPRRPQRKGRPKRKKGEGLLGIPHILATVVWLGLILAIGITGGRMLWVCASDVLAFGREDKPVTITIYEADTMEQITDKLYQAGLIRYKSLFNLYASISDAEEDIQPGIYDLNTRYDYHALVNFMSPRSSREVIQLTIPEGYTCRQIFKLLEENKICTAQDIGAYAANGELEPYWFLENLQRGSEYCLEGYLFPDTYQFYKNSTPREALEKMLDNFDYRFSEKMRAQLDTLNANVTGGNYTVREVTIVASLIEKESAAPAESPAIAGVIYNRLFRWGDTPAYLNIDASLVYAQGGDNSTIDTSIDSPYNTYTHTGLTPTPIANPGLSSLEAALNPESHEYYYYVLNPATGMHQFAATYEEHEANRAQFAAAAAAAREGE